MAESAAPAKKAAAKAKKPAKPSTHPKFSEMITAAITALKSKKGVSAAAIKKYILANYKVEAKSVGTFTKVALKRLVASGAVKQVKGTGASGSFKLAEKAEKPKKKVAAKKATKSPKKATKSPKKAVKKTTTKKAKKPAAKKSPKKTVKKAAKSPAKKPVAKKAKKPVAKKAAAKK